MKLKLFLLSGLLLCVVSICFSQTYIGQEANSIVENAAVVKFKNYSKVPNYVRFSENSTLSEQQAVAVIRSFITNANSDLQLKKVQVNGDSSLTIRYYQTVSGVPIEFTALNLQVKNGKVTEINGEILDNPPISPNFLLSEEDALQKALSFVDAEEYMWQEDSTYFPQGEQVIVPDKISFERSRLKSAYKFDIYSLKPYNRKVVYVDAENGEIILDLPLIHFSNVVGTAQTAYYGQQQINTDYNGSRYTLRDSTRGKGIFTYDCHDYGNYSNATDFFNDSTNWVGSQTKYGTDAHFSTMMTYDYFLQKHGYNSIDNDGFRLRSYVHYNLIKSGNYTTNVNAFWNGNYMTYGDGNAQQGITPLTTIDICGHEITHGLTQFTAGLIYALESGALSEAFSDIFGKSIEFYGVPAYATWKVGEKIGYTMRNLSNPNANGYPSTYQGSYWDFQQEVHKNSTVLSYWFYLLSQGGSGINDFGNNYNVAALGMDKAEQIAFRLLTQYLSPSSGYEDACFYGLQAAVALFGACSDEVKAVGDAFYAIGMLDLPYEKRAIADFSVNTTESCYYPITVQFTNQSYNANSYLWDFGDGTTSTSTNPIHNYTANGNYTVTLIANGGMDCGIDTAIKQNYIQISPDLPCTYFMTQGLNKTVESCHGIVYDDGGPNKPHSSNIDSRLTIYAPNATSIILNFIEFDLEACNCDCDYLTVYRGNSTSTSNRIGRYCNMNLPPSTMTVNGEYVTLVFHSDPYVNLDGFKIEFFCVNPDNPPIASFSADKTVSCEGIIHFEDQTVGTQIVDWLWDFGDGNASMLQHPVHQYYKNGTYTVSLTAWNANGQHTATKNNYILIAEMNELGDFQFEGDKNQAFELHIPNASENLKWYDNNADNLLAATPVFTGNTVLHPAVSSNKTYYVLDSYIGEEYQVGETVSSGTGSFFNSDVVHYLIFDAYQKFNLKSVQVNATSSGNRLIMLRDFRQNVIWTKNVYIPAGTSRITVDKEVPVGGNLQLACESYPNLFRSNTSANLSYPYTIENVVSIKSSSAGSPDALNYYYYFYDWEIKLPDCNSELSTVKIITDIGIAETDNYASLRIYPNPTTGQLRIKNEKLKESSVVEIYDVVGQLLCQINKSTNKQINNEISIDISHLASGLYFVRIDDRVFKVVKD